MTTVREAKRLQLGRNRRDALDHGPRCLFGMQVEWLVMRVCGCPVYAFQFERRHNPGRTDCQREQEEPRREVETLLAAKPQENRGDEDEPHEPANRR